MSKENCKCKENDIIKRIETLENKVDNAVNILEDVIQYLGRIDSAETMLENVITEVGILECEIKNFSHGVKVWNQGE